MSTEKFEAWLQAHEKTGEFFNLSEARAYQHPEEKYDEQYHIANETFVHGAGLVRSLRSARADFSGPALELACGTGLLTVGLVRDCPYPSVIVTDASTKFLEITRRKLATFKSPAPVHLAVLLAEDLQRFPLGSLSLIVLRSALHHFIDVAAFIQVASRALKPGGVLAFEEPCEEGYLLMGLIGQVLTLPEFQRRLSREQLKQMRLFADAMKFYVRRDIDKSHAEDKHLFRLDELITQGTRAGFTCRCFPNQSFGSGVDFAGGEPADVDFGRFFLNYLNYCMGFGPENAAAVAPLAQPMVEYVTEASAKNPRHLTVLGLFKKNGW